MTRMTAALLAFGIGSAGCGSRGETPPERETITAEHRDLAARAEAAMKLGHDNPGREYANRLRSEKYPRWVRQLRGEEPALAGELADPVKDIAGLVETIEKGPDWPMPPRAAVPRAAGPITPDGVLDEADWATAVTYDRMFRFNSTAPVESPETTWKLLWDDEYLYVAWDCADTDVVSPPRERDDHVYFDDCVEIFILPEFRTRTYWELVIGPSGSIYDSVQNKNPTKWGCIGDPERDIQGLKTGIEVRGTLNDSSDTDEGYVVEVAIPFAELPEYSRTGPRAGQTLHFMLVRLDRKGEDFGVYAYQPLQAWGHNIWNFAVMELAP